MIVVGLIEGNETDHDARIISEPFTFIENELGLWRAIRTKGVELFARDRSNRHGEHSKRSVRYRAFSATYRTIFRMVSRTSAALSVFSLQRLRRKHDGTRHLRANEDAASEGSETALKIAELL